MITVIKCKKILSKLPQKTPPCVSPHSLCLPTQSYLTPIPPAGL